MTDSQFMYQFDALHADNGTVVVRVDFILDGVRMMVNLPPAEAAKVHAALGKTIDFSKRMSPLTTIQ